MGTLELWWLGQSGFRLRDPRGGPVVFIDPYLSPGWLRTWPAPVGPGALASANVVLVSHEHVDHFDRPALRAAAGLEDAAFTLVVPRPMVEAAVDLGLPPARVIGAVPDAPLAVAGVRVHPVPACHGVTTHDAYSLGSGRFLGYVIEMGELRVYHAGDTVGYQGLVERVRALRPQVVLLPINGRHRMRERLLNIVGNLNERQAAELAHAVGASLVVPMHWELFRLNQGSPERLRSLIAQRFPGLQVRVPVRTGPMTLTL